MLGVHAVALGEVLAVECHGQLPGHPRQHVDVGAIEVEDFRAAHQADRAEGAPVGAERQGNGDVRPRFASWRRQECRALAHGAGVDGSGDHGAFIFREVGRLQQARLGVLMALLAEEQTLAGIAGHEERDARRVQHREQAVDDLDRQVRRACRTRQGLQHVPQQPHVAVVLVGAAGEDAEEPVGGRASRVGRCIVPQHRLLAVRLARRTERLVGALQEVEGLEPVGLDGLAGHDADGAAQTDAVLQKGPSRHVVPHALGDQPRGIRADVAERQREDGAAVAHEHVGTPQQRLHGLDNFADEPVAGAPAVLLVDGVEAEGIDEQQGERQATAARAIEIGAQHAHELVPPRQTGQRIGQHRVDADDGRRQRVGDSDHRRRAGAGAGQRHPQCHPASRRREPTLVGAATVDVVGAGRAGRHAGPQAGQERRGDEHALPAPARDETVLADGHAVPGASLEHLGRKRLGSGRRGEFIQWDGLAGVHEDGRRCRVPRRRQVDRCRCRARLLRQMCELRCETL